MSTIILTCLAEAPVLSRTRIPLSVLTRFLAINSLSKRVLVAESGGQGLLLDMGGLHQIAHRSPLVSVLPKRTHGLVQSLLYVELTRSRHVYNMLVLDLAVKNKKRMLSSCFASPFLLLD